MGLFVYGSSNIIVFDGYQGGPSTKDLEQDQRSHKKMANVKVAPVNNAHGPQSAFLANSTNKAEMINLLKDFFGKVGHLSSW